WRAICRLLDIFGARCLFRSYYSLQPKLKISEVLIPQKKHKKYFQISRVVPKKIISPEKQKEITFQIGE
ncbi:MAG: hypothetical protein M0Q92_08480, partial [Methanoregula sp.]|nr:hypothetical protein [Methanoregula sp.]